METLRLLLLLLCGSPLSCAASWMWLGVASPGVPEQLGCSGLPLRPQQRELCRRKHFLLPSIQEGAQLAIAECQSQFRHERWNCSTRGQRSVFGHELSSGTRETAFIQAVMAAGLVHAVTRSCSQGNMTECGCAGRLEGGGGLGGGPTHGGPPTGEEEGEGWHWGGCSDQIQYGTWFSRRFLDGEGGNGSTSGGVMMSRHNSEAGRQAVHRTMSRHCRCHGVSGSCGVKTCWRTMAPFGRVGAVLKRSYERSVQLAAGAPRWKSRRKQQQQQEGQRRPLPDGQRLVFLNKSPNYCVEDRQRGVAGTRGRRCSRSSAGAGGCNLLCCGRGYNTHLVRQVQRCHCKFVWCCYVRCRRCESVSDLYTCK